MDNKSTHLFIIIFLILTSIHFLPYTKVYGHGFGIDTISSIDIGDGREVTITIETPMYVDDDNELDKELIISVTDDQTKENVKDVVLSTRIIHQNNIILEDRFFASDGILTINVIPTKEMEKEIQILGEKNPLLDAWSSSVSSKPLQIIGPIFHSGGIYHFEIKLETESTGVTKVHTADVSIAETISYKQKDLNGNDVEFRIKSYFDKISSFDYDPQTKKISFDMPFDWRQETVSHIPLIHEEVHFPKEFTELIYPSYIGTVNGITLFKSSVNVDDYTEKSERIIHFVLLNDQLKFLKNKLDDKQSEQQQQGDDQTILDKMTFELIPSEEVVFPISAMTHDEQFQVDLSWDPIEIIPENPVNFIFTIRDAATGEPLRQTSYDFIILQDGKNIYQNTGQAVIGGSFETFTFSESQTGHTTIRFENIRGTGLDTEFNIVVIPEFGVMVMIVLFVGMIMTIISTMIFLNRTSGQYFIHH